MACNFYDKVEQDNCFPFPKNIAKTCNIWYTNLEISNGDEGYEQSVNYCPSL